MSSPALARALVGALLSAGITDVVCAPGSRSAPILLALATAESAGQVRLHVRVDERSAAYLALGIAKVSQRPVPVVTTSGTAAVNLHPAMVEASYAGVPLVAITADRPGRLRGSGANQTIDQRDLFGVDARWWGDLENADPEEVAGIVAYALAVALDPRRPGPIHVNVPLAEPLVDVSLVEPLAPRTDDPVGQPTRRVATRDRAPGEVAAGQWGLVREALRVERGLIIVGDLGSDDVTSDVAELSRATGWPIIEEYPAHVPAEHRLHPSPPLRHGPLILASEFASSHVPDLVLTVGRVGLHRSVAALLHAAPRHLAVDLHPGAGLADPTRTAETILAAVPVAGDVASKVTSAWMLEWRAAAAAAGRAVSATIDAGPWTAISAIRTVNDHALSRDQIVVGPSNAIRHLSSYADPPAARVLANRGTSGIDGVVSTAWGAAVAHGDDCPGDTTFVILGDLTAIYDRNGLLAAPGEPRPRLIYVVLDNDGGAIFSSLEQGASEYAAHFDRVFGTPHGGDLPGLLGAPGVEVATAHDDDSLHRALSDALEAGGVHVIVVDVASRAEETEQMRAVQRAVNDALKG